MPIAIPADTAHLICRIALLENTHPAAVNPRKTLRAIFEFAEPGQWTELFREFCAAALSLRYAWSGKSPGNLFFVAAKLECLVEACYLILLSHPLPSPGAQGGKKRRPASGKKPLDRLRGVLHAITLRDWKRSLHFFTEAALSNFSVTESLEAPEILRFMQQMESLIGTAAVCCGRG